MNILHVKMIYSIFENCLLVFCNVNLCIFTFSTSYCIYDTCMDIYMYKDVSKSSRTVLVKRSLLTLDVKFLHHLQSTPLSHEYIGPSVSAMLGSIPRSPFLQLCQVPAAIPLESLQWCKIFNSSSEASAWGRGKSHRGPDRVSMRDGGSLSCCSWPKTAKH